MTLKGYVGSPDQHPGWGLGDLIILVGVLVLIFGALRLAFGAPAAIRGPAIDLAPQALPYYTALSVGRMFAAYLLSLFFALAYGYAAARYRMAERGLIPLLDVLQSVPILSFLPVALLSLSAILPESVAVELASIFLIFTSMAWNLAFSAYQSFSTVPKDLTEASAIFQLHPWLRFRLVDLPFAMRSLVWNSMLSWAGGWFFLMAAETFSVAQRDFRLPGLGSYLQAAAHAGDSSAVAWGLAALVVTVVGLDQLLWRPALAWAERFRIELVEAEDVTRSWLYDVVSRAWVVEWALTRFWGPLGDAFDAALARLQPERGPQRASPARRRFGWAVAGLVIAGLGYGTIQAVGFLAQVPLAEWGTIGLAAAATAARVTIAIVVAGLWTVPAGVAMGTNPRISRIAQPAAQVVASIPATALFPVFVVGLLSVAGGLNIAAVLLMLLGTQWYVLFNVLAGASSIPRDLYDTSEMLGLDTRLRWTTLILPALYPYLVTGLITASGGAWNASIVAEYVVVGGQTYQVLGIGAVIASATERGDYAVLFAATVVLIVVVVAINRLLWRRLYARASERFRFD
ncbi:MAG TPA: ABC transporter permease subunit [Anaerolineae bacterium]|nr:ABC transporter permease subunit [Anaerolineae bacterium]